MSTPKQINVPTVLLDAVCKVTLKKSKKSKTPNVQVHIQKPVIYKMISTEEWLKKEEAKKAEEARIQAVRQSPKLEISIKYAMTRPKRVKRTKQQMREYYKQYYFKNKERYKLSSKKAYLKLKKAKIDPFNEQLQS